MSKQSKAKRLITHSEEFHTDDVFATALLLSLFPDAEVIRSRDESVIASGDIVYDVGKVFDPAQGRFDHHQAQSGKRENGITYSAFGLLWREYGVDYCEGDAEAASIIDTKLVMPIDANDNGQKLTEGVYAEAEPFTIDDIIRGMNPQLWVNESEEYDAQFMKAVELAKQILRRLRESVANDLRSQRYLLELYAAAEDKQILVAERVASVNSIVDHMPELLYLVSPRPSGTWGVLAVSEEPGSFTPRQKFPESWRAKNPEELVQLTGVADVTFCHANGFYTVATSRDGAVTLARKSLQA
jgi:uncharacterized UPF0160 family protein